MALFSRIRKACSLWKQVTTAWCSIISRGSLGWVTNQISPLRNAVCLRCLSKSHLHDRLWVPSYQTSTSKSELGRQLWRTIDRPFLALTQAISRKCRRRIGRPRRRSRLKFPRQVCAGLRTTKTCCVDWRLALFRYSSKTTERRSKGRSSRSLPWPPNRTTSGPTLPRLTSFSH